MIKGESNVTRAATKRTIEHIEKHKLASPEIVNRLQRLK